MTADPRTELADAVSALVDPIRHAETYPLRSAYPDGRNAQTIHVWRTVHPSLLDQLASAVEPSGNGDGTARGYESSPSARLDAIDQLRRIAIGVGVWLIDLGIAPRGNTADNLRALVGADTDHDQAKKIARDAVHWVTGARIVTGWDTPARQIPAPCMTCGGIGTLRARPEPLAAMCTNCGQTWTGSDGTIYALGEWVKRNGAPTELGATEMERIAG